MALLGEECPALSVARLRIRPRKSTANLECGTSHAHTDNSLVGAFASCRESLRMTSRATPTIRGNLYAFPWNWNRKSVFILRAYPVGVHDITEEHETLQLVHIGAAHHRQEIEPGSAHALQGQVKRLVGVKMRK